MSLHARIKGGGNQLCLFSKHFSVDGSGIVSRQTNVATNHSAFVGMEVGHKLLDVDLFIDREFIHLCGKTYALEKLL